MSYKILHVKGYSEEENYTYRRKKLNDYLIEKYGKENVTSFCILDDDINVVKQDFDFIVISTVRYLIPVVANINKNIPIFYDRTDRWSALEIPSIDNPDVLNPEAEQMEQWLFENSKHIFVSSSTLIDDIPEQYKKKVTYISNGCKLLPYEPIEKFEKPTVAIVGRLFKKIDMKYIIRLALTNDNYDFNFYGFLDEKPYEVNAFNLSNLHFIERLSEEDLHKELCKCHLGLVSFIESDWTSGMLPLKLFNYANAHIPTLYHNCPSINDYYKDIAIKDSEIEILDDVFKREYNYDKILAESDWTTKFNKMSEIIESNL